MSDSQTTPSPGTDPPGDETAQATQVIRTTDVTQVIRTEDTGITTSDTQVLRIEDTSDTTSDTQVLGIEDTTSGAQLAGTQVDSGTIAHISETSEATEYSNATAYSEATADSTRLPASAEAHNIALAGAAEEQTQTKAGRPWFTRKRFALPSAVIAAFAFIMITTGGNDSGLFRAVTHAAQPTTEVGVKPLPATATIGQSVRDGKFAFMVTGIQQPTKTFTDRFGRTQSAQGVFVVIRVNVSNIGYESRSLNATDMFLVDTTGKRFATSSAILSTAGAETVFLHKINPGQSVTDAPVLFDVAPGTVATSIELHDSMTSRGVQVKLP